MTKCEGNESSALLDGLTIMSEEVVGQQQQQQLTLDQFVIIVRRAAQNFELSSLRCHRRLSFVFFLASFCLPLAPLNTGGSGSRWR